MKLEYQVANPSQCKRLKELGIVQEGQFSWLWDNHEQAHIVSTRSVESLQLLADSNRIISVWKERVEKGIFSAWSVAELGVLLPDVYADMQWYTIPNAGYNEGGENLEPPNCFSLHIGETTDTMDSEPFNGFCFTTEAQARAAYLIMLLEEKSITPEECNKRLLEA